MLVRIAAGITTGTLAIFSAQPTDVVKVRMQAEVKKQGEKSRYKGVVDAYVTIAKTEGFQGLYKGTLNFIRSYLTVFRYSTYFHTHYLMTKHSILGTLPNVARNCIINVGEIVVYDIVKEMILNKGLLEDGIPCHFSAAATAGFTATLVASPVDVVKTRYYRYNNQLFVEANIVNAYHLLLYLP